jgi:hypothetical protein
MSLPVTLEESLTSAHAELNDLHSELRHAEKLCARLQINKKAIQKLKEKLSKAEPNVQEMEVELCFSQKEREAALLQKHSFSDLISQQKKKG